jgi:hypothetical protein
MCLSLSRIFSPVKYISLMLFPVRVERAPLKYFSLGNTTEGKGSYSWPPHRGSLFCKRDKWYFQAKNELIDTSLYKEVNCTWPSASVRVPCPVSALPLSLESAETNLLVINTSAYFWRHQRRRKNVLWHWLQESSSDEISEQVPTEQTFFSSSLMVGRYKQVFVYWEFFWLILRFWIKVQEACPIGC